MECPRGRGRRASHGADRGVELTPEAGEAGIPKVVVNVDGGARGNPGPAAVAAVATTPEGEELTSRGEAIGRATNNVAEYRAMLLGIELARELGASDVELVGDSELIVKQINGQYKVKKPDLRPLRDEVLNALSGFDRWSVRHVRREENEAADLLVNETLDGG